MWRKTHSNKWLSFHFNGNPLKIELYPVFCMIIIRLSYKNIIWYYNNNNRQLFIIWFGYSLEFLYRLDESIYWKWTTMTVISMHGNHFSIPFCQSKMVSPLLFSHLFSHTHEYIILFLYRLLHFDVVTFSHGMYIYRDLGSLILF